MSDQPQERAEQFVQRAQDRLGLFLHLGDNDTSGTSTLLREALDACEQAIHLDPTNANAFFLKGIALLYDSRYQEALAACEQALRLVPDSSAASSNKAYALIHLGRYPEALAACEQAIALDPNNAQAYYYKSFTLTKLGQHQEALLAHEQAVPLDPPYLTASTPFEQSIRLGRPYFVSSIPDSAPTTLQHPARLVVLATGRIFRLMVPNTIVGRESSKLLRSAKRWSPGSAIALPDMKVTNRHACIREDDQGTFTIEDLNSFNKTYVNGISLAPYEKYPLKEGDILRFGETELRFEMS